MTRKDFRFIADTIKSMQQSELVKRVVAEHFANKLSSENPRFNRQKFMDACLKL